MPYDIDPESARSARQIALRLERDRMALLVLPNESGRDPITSHEVKRLVDENNRLKRQLAVLSSGGPSPEQEKALRVMMKWLAARSFTDGPGSVSANQLGKHFGLHL